MSFREGKCQVEQSKEIPSGTILFQGRSGMDPTNFSFPNLPKTGTAATPLLLIQKINPEESLSSTRGIQCWMSFGKGDNPRKVISFQGHSGMDPTKFFASSFPNPLKTGTETTPMFLSQGGNKSRLKSLLHSRNPMLDEFLGKEIPSGTIQGSSKDAQGWIPPNFVLPASQIHPKQGQQPRRCLCTSKCGT